MNLRPVTFTYKTDESKTRQYGLIAEEVADVMPELVYYKDGQPETVYYQHLAPILLNEYQKQQRKLEGHDVKLELHDKQFDGSSKIIDDLLVRVKQLEESLGVVKRK